MNNKEKKISSKSFSHAKHFRSYIMSSTEIETVIYSTKEKIGVHQLKAQFFECVGNKFQRKFMSYIEWVWSVKL